VSLETVPIAAPQIEFWFAAIILARKAGIGREPGAMVEGAPGTDEGGR